MTPLDALHARGGGEGTPFLAAMLTSELTVWLEAEDPPTARLLQLEEGPVAIAFDRPERLAAMLEAPAPSAAMSGRALVTWLAGQRVGLALNLAAPSATVWDAAAVAWMAERAAPSPEAAAASLSDLVPPAPEAIAALALVEPLLAALPQIEGAWLAGVRGAAGLRHVLALEGAAEPTLPALADALSLASTPIDLAVLSRAQRPAFARHGIRVALDRPAAAPPGPPRLT